MLRVLFPGKLNVLIGSAALLQRRLQRFVFTGPYVEVFDAHIRKLCKSRKYDDDDDYNSIKTEVCTYLKSPNYIFHHLNSTSSCVSATLSPAFMVIPSSPRRSEPEDHTAQHARCSKDK